MATKPPAEPRALQGEILFEEGDFHALSDPLCRDAQYNDRRLVTRRKLLTLAKRLVTRAKEGGLALDPRTSLHNPTVFNHMRVRRIWAYIARSKAERKRLKSELGPELGADLNAAYRNAYLCLAIEDDALEVSLRIHADAWFDGRNLIRRIEAEGARAWLQVLNTLEGYRLRLDDWKGEWFCGQLEPEALDEFLRYYTPGEHGLAIEQRIPAPAGARGVALEAGVAERMIEEALRLVPAYRFMAWSTESDFLFGG